MPTRKLKLFGIPLTAAAQNWNKLLTHRISCRRSWPRGVGELNPSPHSCIFTSVSMDSSSLSYLFTSVQIPADTTPKCGTEPSIRYVKLHFQNWHVVDSLRYRNRAKNTILMCEQKPYPQWFSCRRKGYSVKCEDSLKSGTQTEW